MPISPRNPTRTRRRSSSRTRAETKSSRAPCVARVLKPLVEEVDAPWAAFHTFRHTFASIHLSEGTNLLQLSRALGHHSAAFTLSRYTHLLPGDEAPALDLWTPPAPTPAAVSPGEVFGVEVLAA